jgi:hypothetical protein
MPITANIIHTAKQIVKATVLVTSTDSDCRDRDTMPASVDLRNAQQDNAQTAFSFATVPDVS